MKLHRNRSHARSKKAGQAAAKAAVTLTASAGLLMGGLFASPNDLLQQGGESAASPAAIVEVLNDEPIDLASAEDAAQEAPEEEDQRRRGWKAALRSWILRLPFGVRAAVCVPLWGIGWALAGLLSALWGHILSPVLGTFAGWLALAAVILACTLGIVKTAFPDLPLKKILNRKTICFVLAGVTLCAGLDWILPEVWDGYGTLQAVLRLAGSTAVLAAVSLPFFRKKTSAA